MVALFAFFACLMNDAPLWAFLVGFLCLLLEGS